MRDCRAETSLSVVLSALTGEIGSRLDVEVEVEYYEAVADYAGLHKPAAGIGHQQPLQGWIWSGYSNGKGWPTPRCSGQADDGQHCGNDAMTDVLVAVAERALTTPSIRHCSFRLCHLDLI